MKLRKFAWILGSALLLCLIAGAAALYWASHSEVALRWGIEFAARRLPGKLVVAGIHGALLEPIKIDALTYEDDALRVEAYSLALDWFPMALLHDKVDVSRLQTQRMRVVIKSRSRNNNALPSDLGLPVQIQIASMEIGQLAVDGASMPIGLKGIAATYQGGPSSHRLDLRILSATWGNSMPVGPANPRAGAQDPAEVQLRLGVQLQLGAQSPFPLSGHASADVAFAHAPALSLQTDLSGTLMRLSAAVHAQINQLSVEAVTNVKPFDTTPIESVTAHSTDIDLSQWIEGAPRTALGIQIEGRQTGAEQFTGHIAIENAKPGTVDRQLVPLHLASGEFTAEPRHLHMTTLAIDLGNAGQFAGSAALTAQGGELALTTSNLNLRGIHGDLRNTKLTGSLRAKVAEEHQSLVADLRESGVQVQLDATHQSGTVQLQRLLARSGTAELSGSGTLTTVSPNNFFAQGTLKRFNPAQFGNFPAAVVNGTFSARGQLHPQWLATIAYAIDRSIFRRQPLSGHGRLTLAPNRIQDTDAQLTLGSNRLSVRGALGRLGDQLAFELDGRELAAFGMAVSGTVQASGMASGTFARPALTFKLEGRALTIPGSYSIQHLDARGSIAHGVDRADNSAEDPAIELRVYATGLARKTLKLATASVAATGSLRRHTVDLETTAADSKLTARLEGGWQQQTGIWRGSLSRFESHGKSDFALTQPAAMSFGKDQFSLSAASIAYGEANLSIVNLDLRKGTLTSAGQFVHLPAALLLSLNEKLAGIDSSVLLGGRWSLQVDEHVNGRIEASRESGDLIAPSDPPVALGIERATADVHIVDDRVSSTLELAASRLGKLNGTMQTTLSQREGNWGIAGSTPLRLQAHASIGSLKPVFALFAKNFTGDGRITLDVERDGPASEAKLQGRIEGDALRLDYVEGGLFLRDGKLRATFSDEALNLDELTMLGGRGRISAKGKATLRPELGPLVDIRWTAEKLAAINRPDVQLILSGGGDIKLDRSRVDVHGQLKADQGRIVLRDQSMPELGNDVVVLDGRKKREPLANRVVRSEVDLKLDLGPDFTIKGRGVDAQLGGQLALMGTPNSPLTAEGKIFVVRGTFEAYSQRLAIEKGTLYFTGPLDNPGLEIRAMRLHQQVEAGVEITGTARDPHLRLVSKPEVPDNEKLAWLVLGRNVEATNRSDSEAMQANAMALAAQLGTAPINAQLAKAVGLDEIRVAPSTSGSTTGGVVSLGKRVADKVYVTYEYSVNKATSAIAINYQLSTRWSIRTSTGTSDAIDLFYSLSFD
jgi:translocation and assembly module TamB